MLDLELIGEVGISCYIVIYDTTIYMLEYVLYQITIAIYISCKCCVYVLLHIHYCNL